MSDFNFVPSWGSDLDTEARVNSSKFGDGYEQRVGDGLNTMPLMWNLKFETLTSANADTIENFFRTKNGTTPFTWTPPGKAEIKVIARKWKRSYPDYSQSISVVFEQVFDP